MRDGGMGEGMGGGMEGCSGDGQMERRARYRAHSPDDRCEWANLDALTRRRAIPSFPSFSDATLCARPTRDALVDALARLPSLSRTPHNSIPSEPSGL